MTSHTRNAKSAKSPTPGPNAAACPKTRPVRKPRPAAEPTPVDPKHRTPRTNTKQAKLIAMLKGNGATIEEMATALEWQPHTVRGALAGALRKRLGLDVSSEKVEGRGRVYRLAD